MTLGSLDFITSFIENDTAQYSPVQSFGAGTLFGGDAIGNSYIASTYVPQGSSFSFESVRAKLTPFSWPDGAQGGPLSPIIETGGLIFPFTPNISEGVSPNYESTTVSQTNESFLNFSGRENPKIGISDAKWVCDTYEHAVYAVAVMHFFRAFSMMDFGKGRSGKPPSPMWFSAYGKYAYERIPVILRDAQWSFPNDVDYVGIPNPGSSSQKALVKSSGPGGDGYTWMPMVFTVSLNLTVQHSPKYWTEFNLDDVFSGKLLDIG